MAAMAVFIFHTSDGICVHSVYPLFRNVERTVNPARFRYPCCSTTHTLSLLLETSTGTWNVEVWQIYLQPLVWIVSMKIWSLVSLWVWQYGGQRGACVMWNETCNMTRSFMNPGLRSNIHLLVICSQSQVLYRLKKSWICYHSSKGVYR